MRPPAARMNVFAMPPPTISASTFAASARRIVSFVETFAPADDRHQRPPRIRQRPRQRVELRRHQRPRARDRRELARCRASSPRRGARCRTRRSRRRRTSAAILLRERLVVLLLALVDAAVLEQHDVAGLERGVPLRRRRPSRGSAAPAAEQLRSRCATGASESAGENSPSVGRPRCDVTITAAPRASASRMPGTEARMRVSSVMRARVVLRHVQVGADEDAACRARRHRRAVGCSCDSNRSCRSDAIGAIPPPGDAHVGSSRKRVISTISS